jgi:hypothetical protein
LVIPNERRATPSGAFSGATRRAGAVFPPSGVIIRSCSLATPRSFCLAGRKNSLSGEDISEMAESDNMRLFENHRIYVSSNATEWAPINDLGALKKIFDSKGGSLSLGIGMSPKSGISSHLEIKEDR